MRAVSVPMRSVALLRLMPGKRTSRTPTPLRVPDSLEPRVRDLVATTCERRAALELQGAAAFTAVTQALFDLRADAAIVEMSAQAIVDEMRHSEIYRGLAEMFWGASVPRPQPAAIPIPAHLEAPPALRPALQVVGMCAINETMACSFLDLCFQCAELPAVRSAVHEVLRDEVRHGQIGWAWLASCGVTDRAAIAPFVLPMLRLQLRGWRAQMATLPQG